MSRLDELIAELCPDGVEYKKLGEVATVSRGGSFQKKDFEESGVPCIHYGQIYTTYGLFATETVSFISKETASKQKKAVTGDVIMAVTSENIEDVCKCVAWLGEGEVAVSGHAAIIHHNQDPKYLVYYLRSSLFFDQKARLAHGTKVIEVRADSLLDVVVPIPPLPVQHEIVRILDSFTELTATLKAELTAELTARKQQYEYYLDNLFDFGESTPRVQLGEAIISLNTGLNPRQFFKLNTDDAKNYYITIREIVNGSIMPTSKTDRMNDEAMRLCNNRSNLEAGDVLFSGTGTIGETAVLKETPSNWNIKEGVYTIKPNPTMLDSHFLRYLLMSKKMREIYMKKVAGGTVKSIPMKEMKLLSIPLPTLIEQQQIVNLVMKLDDLRNNISDDLPAEIEARQKQYEYYRNKLLIFKES